MSTLQQQLAARLHARLAAVAPDADLSKVAVGKSKAGHGSDFQTAAAMQLAKVLRRKPRDIAEEIVAGLDVADLATVDVAGPGFIGFTLIDSALSAQLADFLIDRHRGVPQRQGTVVIDFSSPNVAKRMHIGHIRSTIIGDALRRMGVALGYRVIGDNHIGDWGTQFGQLIHAYREWLDEESWSADAVGELERLYVKFHQAAHEDDSLNEIARAELAKLQGGDPDNRALWQLFIDSSRHAFDAIYDRLDIHFDVTYGESHYDERLQPLVNEMLDSGVAEHSDGAVCVFFRDDEGEDTMTPFLIRKQDGAALYATSDIATVEFRRNEWDPDQVIYVTDMRQQLHFQQLFATVRKMGYDIDLRHVWFGMMSLPEGAMATRKGNVIRLVDLLDEAERRARAMLDERLEGKGFSDEELTELATIIGLGSVKYADLANNPQTNIVFSFDKMLSFEGNTAPYLQYTSARTHSLQRRAAEAGLEADGKTFAYADEQDRDLLLAALGLGAAVEAAYDSGKPSTLATFLYELAQRYHRWYAHCPVLKAPEPPRDVQISRLNLNALVQVSLVHGLSLLGIRAPERM